MHSHNSEQLTAYPYSDLLEQLEEQLEDVCLSGCGLGGERCDCR